MLDWQQIKHHHGVADERRHGGDSGADEPHFAVAQQCCAER
jgi:hypothetical protein